MTSEREGGIGRREREEVGEKKCASTGSNARNKFFNRGNMVFELSTVTHISFKCCGCGTFVLQF